MAANITSTLIPKGVNEHNFHETQQSTLCNVRTNNRVSFATGCCSNPLTASNVTNKTSINSVDQNTAFNYITNDLEDNEYHDLFASCKYFEIDETNQTLSKVKSCQRNLFVMHFNVRSLQKNFSKLSLHVSQLSTKPDVIAITETKLNDAKINDGFKLTEYKFTHKNSPTKAGGVAFYVKKELSYTLINSAGLNLNAVKGLRIKIEAKPAPIVVGVIYRHPNYDVDRLNSFGDELANKLHSYNLNNAKYCISVNTNINLLNIKNSGNIRKYANNLISCSCKCLIDLPTRISQNSKTLIDRIYTNIANTKVESGIAVTDISDHCGTFANFLLKSVCKNTKSYNFVRDMKNFQPELFLESLIKKLNNFALSDNKPVDPQCNKFMTVLTDPVNEHAPLKKASRREKTLQKNHG